MTDTNAPEGQAPATPATPAPAAAAPPVDTETQAAIADLRERIEQRDARNENRPQNLEAQLSQLLERQSEAFGARTEAKQAAATVAQDVEALRAELRTSQARERATALGFGSADDESGQPVDHEALQIALSTPDPIATLNRLAKLAPVPKTVGGRTIGTGSAAGAAGGEDAIDRLAARLAGNG